MKRNRVGGLKLDPAVLAWQKRAAENKSALTQKQKKDRQRVRVKYDLEPELKSRIEQAAAAEGTSASQFAAFLLDWVMARWQAEGPDDELHELVYQAKTPSRSLRFEWDLEPGEENK